MTELRRYLTCYDTNSRRDLVYDTHGYQPHITAPGEGWTPDDKDQLEKAANDNKLIFARTHSGDVWKIGLWRFNKKTITLEDPRTTSPGGKQRLKYEEIESLGTCPTNEDDAQGKDVDATTANTEPVAHADRDHALLSASSAHRWLNCTPAPYLEAKHPDTTSEAAEEGTAAHELAEHKLRQHLDMPTTRPESEWHNEEMDDYTDQYADHVMAELTRARDTDPAAFLSIEERLDFSHIVPDGFGTGDALILGGDTLTIVDLKYGKGVEVSAVGNPQMRLYALGALATYGMIYDIDKVRMVIFQPRIGNISVDEITADELTAWAEDVVRPAAEKAIAGEGELQAGEWCRFCRHAAQCPALASEMFAPVPTSAEHVPAAPDPDTLTDDQIATIVTHAGELKKWLTKVESYALAQATEGRAYPGLKLVEGRSVRKYTDEDDVARAVEAAGEDPYKPREVLGITAMTKLLGKKRFEELLGDYVHKPEGKPALVPESDKRPALTPVSADTVFGHIEKGA